MTLDQFVKLPLTQQWLLMRHLGVEVAKRRDNESRYFLYQFDSFYIEAKMCLEEESLKELNSFTTGQKLNQYLDAIDISKVLF